VSVGLGLGLVFVHLFLGLVFCMFFCFSLDYFVLTLLWSPYVIGQTIIFLPCGYYLFSFPRLISAAGDWMFTILPHMVWP